MKKEELYRWKAAWKLVDDILKLELPLEPRYIYVIGNRKMRRYKIGIAKDIWQRTYAIQNMSPVELEVIAYKRITSAHVLENVLHELFIVFRVWGEWFDLPDDIFSVLVEKLSEDNS